ncbi:MAG: BlaI/MecI/CopY family transcriptional regulator [Spirosomataceae bacterium]
MNEEHFFKPTESELEILQVLWRLGKATVRQVHDELAQNKEVGYTTTLKLLQIMHEKGIVARTEEGRYHVYEALAKEQETQQTLLSRFVDTTFGGSAMKMVLQALGNHKASKAELDEIRKLLDQMEG